MSDGPAHRAMRRRMEGPQTWRTAHQAHRALCEWSWLVQIILSLYMYKMYIGLRTISFVVFRHPLCICVNRVAKDRFSLIWAMKLLHVSWITLWSTFVCGDSPGSYDWTYFSTANFVFTLRFRMKSNLSSNTSCGRGSGPAVVSIGSCLPAMVLGGTTLPNRLWSGRDMPPWEVTYSSCCRTRVPGNRVVISLKPVFWFP